MDGKKVAVMNGPVEGGESLVILGFRITRIILSNLSFYYLIYTN